MYLTPTHPRPTARIAGLGTFLPEQVLTSAELERRIRDDGVAISPGFIERATGIEERRRARRGENASDLAVGAARGALGAAGIGADAVDILIFSAASHDVTEPATANIVQSKLDARNAIAFDLKNACNSFLSALDVADGYIQLGRARVVLIAIGEVPSVVTDLRVTSREDLAERFSHLTVGDAGAAVVLVPSDDPERGIRATAAVTRGSAWELGTVLSFGTMYLDDRSVERALLRSRGCELEACARAEMPAVMLAAIERAGWTPDSVDVVACHQHTRKISFEICKAAGIPPERVALPLRYAGNAASANIPLAMADAERRGALVPGARVLLCGGSAGFSAIATALTW